MPKKENLFRLIKSLTKSEKRYFRLMTGSIEGDKNYLKLFDFLDRQAEFDQEALKHYFEGEAFARQLHVAKNYLHGLIMKSLRSFHAKQSKNAQLKNLLFEIEILHKKELYDDCYYTLKKAKTIAEKYERFDVLLEIYGWERTLLQVLHGLYKARVDVLELIKKEKEAIGKIDRHNQYLHITFDMFNYDITDVKVAQSLLNQPIVQQITHANSLSSKTLYYHIHYALNSMTGQTDKGIDLISELIQELEKYPWRIRENPNSYITALSNKMGALLHAGRLDEVPAILEKIKAFPEKYDLKQDNSMLRMLLKAYNVELELYRDTRQLDKAVALINETETFIEKNRGSVNDGYFLSFHYQFAYIWFLKADYSNALMCLNKIINEKFGGMREDIQSYARMLNLIIHFELNNIIVIKYSVDACRRFLKKKRTLQQYEKVLLKFFSRISTSPVSEYTALFHQLNNELFIDMDLAEKKNVLDYLDFESWVLGKLHEGE